MQPSNKAYPGRPAVCRNCGALVGAGEQACAQCGAMLDGTGAAEQLPQGGAADRALHETDAMRFAWAVLNRPYFFTIIFLIANIFVFLLMWASSGLNGSALWEFSGPVLQAYGAKLNYLIRDNQEWWRFVTPVFIHVSLPHLLINMYSLWMIGPYVEKLYGSAKFVVFWVAAGIMGVVASYLTVRPAMHVSSVGRFLFKAVDTPSAGASGALFGLVGVLFVFGIKFRHELPEGFKRAFGTGLLPMIGLNLFIGYLGRGFIDNAAHLGGLAAGALLALFVGYKRPHEPARVAVFWHILQTAALAIIVLSFFMVWRHYTGPPPVVDAEALQRIVPPSNAADIMAYIEAMNAGQTAFLEGLNKMDVGQLDRSIKQLESVPSVGEKPDAMRNDLKALVVRAREFAALTQSERRTRNAQANLKKLLADYEAWEKGFNEWVKTDGEKYGLKLSEPSPTPPPSPAAKASPQIPSNGK
jgi:rhomboid protease GluP